MASNPFDDYFEKQRDAQTAFRIQAAKPDETARAQAIARERGIPAAVVQSDLPNFEAQQRATRANEVNRRHPAIGRWSANASNATIAADDYSTLDRLGSAFMNRVALDKMDIVQNGGFLDRMGDLFKSGLYSLESGAASFRGALQDWSARNPLPWTSRENTARDRAGAAMARAQARIYSDVGGTQVAGETTWDTLKARPTIGNVLAFGLDTGVKSVPGMAQAALAAPLYVAGQAGNIGQTRAQVQGREDATAQDVVEAAPAAVLSLVLERVGIHGIFGAGGRTALGRIAQAGATEATTEFGQSMVEYIGGHSQTGTKFDTDEMFDQAFAGMVAGGLMGGGLRASGELSRPALRPVGAMVSRISDANSAMHGGTFLNEIATATAQSKTAKRAPDAIADLVQQLGEDNGVDQVYLPAEAVRSYMQSDGYAGDLDGWRVQIDEAEATGGDLVLPVGELTRLATTPGWESLKSDIRLSAGGMSLREAETFNEAWTDAMEQLSDSIAQEAEQARAAAAPREQLLQSLTEKLTTAGMSPSMARQNAEFLAQRASTRATRMGRDLAGTEFDGLQVRQILPENIAAAQKADQLDIAIDVMKRKLDPSQNLGPTLMQFIAKEGGIVDTGGDLKSMGADAWHKGRPGQRRLLRDQGELLEDGGFGENEYGPDAWAQRAWEAGYFPEFGDQRPSANDLLEAISEGVAGRDRTLIAREKSVRDAAEELRALLENRGIDPDTTSRREIRAAVEAYSAEEADGDAYMQGDLIPRGRILFPGGQSAAAIIELYQTQNPSTFLHESGHLWLEELREDAADADAPQQVRDDWAIVEGWFAANGHPLENGAIPVDAHELWARGVERYLMEGKAPSPGLQRLFQTFKAWMISLYNSVSRLNTPISDEVRGVMDRLIATDEELADAIAAQHLEALFPQKPASMTDAEYTAYQNLAATARDQAQSRMLAKTMNAVKRRVTKEWREREEEVRQDVTERIDALPEFRALVMARETPLDTQWIKDTLGEDAAALLPKDFKRLHKEGGANPDDVAELAGYRTGDEMVRALMGIEIRRREMRENGDKRSVRKAMIDQEVEGLMLERFGDPFTDGSIEQEALAAAQSDEMGAVMSAELRVLGRMTGQRVTPYSVAKNWAERQITDGRVRDVASRSAIIRYERAAAKAGRAAMDAVIAKDHEEAFRQKQSQMLNNALVAAARRGADQVDEAVKRLEKWAKRRTVKGVDQDYLERAQLLLEQVEMKERTQRSLNRQESFEAWAAERQAEGFDVVVPPSFAESIGRTHWTRLKVGQLLALNDAVVQIIHLGRHKQSLLDAKEERDYQAVVSDTINQVEALISTGDLKAIPENRTFLEPGFFSRAKSSILSIDASLLKMETVFDWLDGGRFGMFKRVVFQRIVDAQERRRTMTRAMVDALEKAQAEVPKEVRKRWGQKVALPFIDPRNGQQSVMTRDQLISMALNLGNEGNAEKLAGGYGWGEQSMLDMLNQELTPAEWTYVQKVWDIVDTLWPDIAALERRINGVEPDKIEAREVQTNAGTLRGGYFPVVYDTSRDLRVEKLTAIDADQLFGNGYKRSSTRAGSTNERTEVRDMPILLSPSVLSRHITEVVHDITHREAMMDTHRFLNDPRIVTAVREVMGEEIQKQFNPWLHHISNELAYEAQGLGALEKAMKSLRVNATFVGLGFRWTTVAMQISGFVQTAEVLGPTAMAKGVFSYAQHPIASFPFVLERSQEVRSRMDTMDRDMKDMLNNESKLGKTVSDIRATGFMAIGAVDRFVSVVSWMAAYNKSLETGAAEDVAIAYADEVIRKSQGSGAAKDIAGIMRGKGSAGELLKAITPFYSFMSAYYQRQRNFARDTGKAFRKRDAAAIPGLVTRFLLLYVFPALAAEWLAGRWPDDDDEESFTQWALQTMGLNALGPLPVVRDLANVAVKGFDSSVSSVDRFVSTASRTIKDMKRLAEGEDTKRATRNAMEVAGYFGAPTSGQMAATSQFLVEVYSGDQNPQGFAEWWEGLTKGKIKED
jgi:hypothetical protein